MESENRREYFRAEIIIAVKWQVLNEEEIEMVKNGRGSALFDQPDISGPIAESIEQVPPGSTEELLFRCFQQISNKLDFIIDQLFYKPSEEASPFDNVIELSGSGLKFNSRRRLNAGTLLKMKILMPDSFQYLMEFITEIVRSEEIDSGYVIAAKIIKIDEDARDSIIKVILQKQRREIRKNKAGDIIED